MIVMRTILHPTDFSEASLCAFEMACSLAHNHGARLILLHVVSPDALTHDADTVPPLAEELLEDGRTQLNQLRPAESEVQLERRLAIGEPVEQIARIAQETRAGLIVVGTHGRSSVGRLLMGSVAENVMRTAPCPVLAVKPLPQPARVVEPAAARVESFAVEDDVTLAAAS